MTCANETHSAAYTWPTPRPIGWNRPKFIKAIVAIVDAFDEALQLRRAAHRHDPFGDQ